MAKNLKPPASPELLRLRAALATNLRAYITVMYGSGIAETAAADAIGKATKLGKNTVLRALGRGDGDIDIRLDTLVRLAAHFQASAQDLLLDHGGLAAYGTRRAAAPLRVQERARDERTDSVADRAPLHRRRSP